MKKRRGLTEFLLRAFCATTIIISICLSLTLPYTSHYYAKDQRIVLKQANRNVTAKLEVSTNVFTYPAECKKLGNLPVIGMSFRIASHLSSCSGFSFAAMQKEMAFTLYLNTADELVKDHPSRVIVLRKLLI